MKVSDDIYNEIQDLKKIYKEEGLAEALECFFDYVFLPDHYNATRVKAGNDEEFLKNIINYITDEIELEYEEGKYHLTCDRGYVFLNVHTGEVFIHEELFANQFVKNAFRVEEITNDLLLDNPKFERILIKEED